MAQISYKNQIISTIFVVLLHLTIWLPQSTTLPQGAPETICDTMLPFHGGGILPSNAVPPFRIETSTATIGQGQTMRVNIVGVPSGLTFGGFMIQARNNNPPNQIIGQFNPTEDGLSKLMNCENSVRNSVTHTSTVPKPEISLEWQSPVDFEGEIVFNSTVAQAYDTFWVGLPSAPVRVVRRDVAQQAPTTPRRPYVSTTRTSYTPQYVPPSPTPVAEDGFYAGCGTSKNCFGNRNGCVDSKSCDFVTSVKVRGAIYEFELKSKIADAAYVAVGLSDDDKMGDDLVLECVPQNGQVSKFSSLTSGKPNYGVSRLEVPQNTARLLEGSVINGVIYCKVEHEPVTRVGNHVFDLQNKQYYLLIAAGNSLKENGVGYHNLGRLPSNRAINLAVLGELGAASTLLLRLHGSFMIAAWIGTTSLGIIFARYFKQTWVGSQMCGKDQWFAWHRICMVTTWCLTMAAFVIIFVEIDGWSGERNPHAILGTITTILCFIQPVGALFRPGPNSKNRPFFNWAHWFGGNLAHLLAVVTIFFSVKLAKAQLPDWLDWILVAYVAFHVVVHLIFSIAGCSSDRQQTKRVNEFQMGHMGHHHHGMRNSIKMERRMDAPYAGFRKGLLAVYTVVLILFVVALIVIVALAPIGDTFNELKARLN